jgi:SAM-dependent methyltransferase
MDDSLELQDLRTRLAAEERGYAEFLAEIDALANFRLPFETRPDLPGQLQALNDAWPSLAPPTGISPAALWRKSVWRVMNPSIEHQTDFNAILVQVLNGFVDESAKLYAHLRNLISVLVRHTQTVLPVMDARDRVATALATTRAELILESFDRRQEALARRLEGLLALKARLEAVGEEVRAVRGALEAKAPTQAVAEAATRAAEDSAYVAFEGFFRGERDEIRARLADYVPHFRGQAPVVDLGCGRGEFLELLRAEGIDAYGVEGNLHVVQEDVARGLQVVHGDLLQFLAARADGSCGGVFAAQVAEHLPPPVLTEMLKHAYRVLRPGGVMLLETVNPRSVIAVMEVFNRDLTHQRTLHPDTLSFLASAAGFTEVRVELRSPVDPAATLQPVPVEGLPEPAAQVLNENVARLNAFLYGPQDYALIARR